MTAKVFRSIQDTGWTKQSVYDQLGDTPLSFDADDMADDDVQWWVESEYELRDNDLGEENYARCVKDFNVELIALTLTRLGG